MAKSRRYNLLCPIARALDRVGDRWALLILRDLHAGPARYKDLQQGLTGIATNLLSDRLQALVDDGLVLKKENEWGVTLYELTPLGKKTRPLLFELAMLGGRFARDAEPREPGNLRTVAVTLSAALERVADPDAEIKATIVVDGEPFSLNVADGRVSMVVGEHPAPDVILKMAYEPMLAASEGEMSMEEFSAKHVEAEERHPGKKDELFLLLGSAMAQFTG